VVVNLCFFFTNASHVVSAARRLLLVVITRCRPLRDSDGAISSNWMICMHAPVAIPQHHAHIHQVPERAGFAQPQQRC
jgi:hypothetical protein